MSTTIPAGRIHLDQEAPRAYAAMFRFEQSIELDPALKHLVVTRASQINGCAFCLDMHWKDARADGVSDERLYSLDAWEESPLYDARERAALALTEAVTRLDKGHVPDGVWDEAASEFEPAELAQLLFAIVAINSWNRLMIASRTEPGHYQPGMFG